MGANVFLAHCDADGFERSVGSTVDPTAFSDAPDELGDDAVRLWGVEDGTRNRNYFEAMEAGDLVLFYVDGEYVGTGRVGTTVEDEAGWASDEVWEDTDATLLYTVESFQSVAVPGDAVHGIFDYSAGYTPDALSRVADGRLDNSVDAVELAVQRFTKQIA